MKHILFINGHLNTGGVERSLVDILRHIDYTKYSVDLLLLEDTGDYLTELPSNVRILFRDIHDTYGNFISSIHKCITHHNWLCLHLRILFLLEKIISTHAIFPVAKILLGKHHYDCVIGFRPGICSDLAAYSVLADRRITWWHHGDFNVNKVQYANMCSKMNAITVVSQTCVKMLKDNIPTITDKMVCIPNMLDSEAIRQKVGCSPYSHDVLHIVSVGRLSPEKHFENIIHVAKVLRRFSCDFMWHILGDGSERANLEMMIKENALENLVILEGTKSNPYSYIKYADLFVHPSYVESQGLTILEAMSLGVPCVVTKSRGPCEFIQDGVNGLLTEQSSESLTEKVLEIMSDIGLYNRIKENTKCPERFDPNLVMLQIEFLIDGEEQ